MLRRETRQIEAHFGDDHAGDAVTRKKVNPVSVVAARDGSLWIGGEYGLHRWRDGRTTTYRTLTHPGLPDDRIQSLYEDDRGRIWVTGLHGLAVFHNDAFSRDTGRESGIRVRGHR